MVQIQSKCCHFSSNFTDMCYYSSSEEFVELCVHSVCKCGRVKPDREVAERLLNIVNTIS